MPIMNAPKPETCPPYRLRASALCTAAGSSSMLRVARTSTLDQRAPVLRVQHQPQQLAFDFHRGSR
jgi:hypothetical protein